MIRVQPLFSIFDKKKNVKIAWKANTGDLGPF